MTNTKSPNANLTGLCICQNIVVNNPIGFELDCNTGVKCTKMKRKNYTIKQQQGDESASSGLVYY